MRRCTARNRQVLARPVENIRGNDSLKIQPFSPVGMPDTSVRLGCPNGQRSPRTPDSGRAWRGGRSPYKADSRSAGVAPAKCPLTANDGIDPLQLRGRQISAVKPLMWREDTRLKGAFNGRGGGPPITPSRKDAERPVQGNGGRFGRRRTVPWSYERKSHVHDDGVARRSSNVFRRVPCVHHTPHTRRRGRYFLPPRSKPCS
jgi:hypothetical protein